VEGLELNGRFPAAAFAGKRVFLTGHTGFKGTWMTAMLRRLGCEVYGYAMPPQATPNLFDLTLSRDLLAGETLGDIRDVGALRTAMAAAAPHLVIHMAAQAFVRRSYLDPVDTWGVNVMGTVNVLEVARAIPGIAGVVVVTTDKCYENRGWEWGYRENDPLGGHDPYSASKAGVELVVQSYRRSFFASGETLLASGRAGNVIGGGDWSEDRLVADAARAAALGQAMSVRNPAATRPWQHVLDCLGGYLALAGALLEGDASAATAFNFGPDIADNVSVGEVLRRLQTHWPELQWAVDADATRQAPHEASYLYLDSGRARQHLHWRPVWQLDQALERTAIWYRNVQADASRATPLLNAQIDEYFA
jgi:CDP-glucose 4,6-dehydratase